jgi:hypothetical protein
MAYKVGKEDDIYNDNSIPGPAALFIMTNATLYGWKKAIFVALGNVTSLFCFYRFRYADGTIVK